MEKVWVFTLIDGGILDNLKIASEDMEDTLIEYAIDYTLAQAGLARWHFNPFDAIAWRQICDELEDHEDIVVSLQEVTVGDLSDD